MNTVKITTIFIALTLCLFCALAAGCGKPEQAKADSASVVKSSFTDARDGKEYRAVKIGEYMWMAENLNFKTGGSWCYDNDDANCEKYGRLYNWDAAMEACPAGWRLPDTANWNDLLRAVGGLRVVRQDEFDGELIVYDDSFWEAAGLRFVASELMKLLS